MVACNADAGVGDRKPQGARFAGRLILDHQTDLARLGEFQRIANKVDEDLPQTRRIAVDRAMHIRRDEAEHRDRLFAREDGKTSKGAFDQLVKIEVDILELDIPALESGVVEDVVDDPQKSI